MPLSYAACLSDPPTGHHCRTRAPTSSPATVQPISPRAAFFLSISRSQQPLEHTLVESIVLSIISMLSSPNDESPANVEATMALLRGLVDNPYWCMEKNFHCCVELI